MRTFATLFLAGRSVDGFRTQNQFDKFLSKGRRTLGPFGGSATDAFGAEALKVKVEDICRSAVRREEGTQCQYQDPDHYYQEQAVYQLCLDDWYGVSQGMGSVCWKKHGENTAASGCGRACLYKSLKTLVAKHGAVSELLKWGVTDFNLWNQITSLTKPTADGLTEQEIAWVFEHCADGGDRAFIAIPRIHNVFACVDSDKNGRIDGAELTQPAGCFKKCLEAKEPAGHVNQVPDDADVTDVLKMWLTGGENAPGSFQEMVGGDQDCIEGDQGPCEGCESYHEDFDPMAHREAEDEVQMWDEDGDLLEECEGFRHRCEHNPDDEECLDTMHTEYCKGVQAKEKEHLDRCLSYFQKCCPNAVAGDGDVLLESCQPIENPSQKDWFAAHAGQEQGGCYVLDTKAEFMPEHGPKLNYPELSFCGGVFERARYDMIEAAKLEGDTHAGVPDDVSGGVAAGFFMQLAQKKGRILPSQHLLNSQQKESRDLPHQFEYFGYESSVPSSPLSQVGITRASKFFANARNPIANNWRNVHKFKVDIARNKSQLKVLNPRTPSMKKPTIMLFHRKQDPAQVQQVGDNTAVEAVDPAAPTDSQVSIAPAPIDTNAPDIVPAPQPLNAGQGVAPAAEPASDAEAYDSTIHEDAINQPKCPVEQFMDMQTGEEHVVRNEEYYHMFCAWMHEVSKPAAGWDLGHFIDQATVKFADRQFEADATCQPEVTIQNSIPRPTRDQIHDDNIDNCQQAWEICEASNGSATQCQFIKTEACKDFKPIDTTAVVEAPLPAVKVSQPTEAPTAAPAAPVEAPKPAGVIPAGTGETAQVIPVGTGGELPEAAPAAVPAEAPQQLIAADQAPAAPAAPAAEVDMFPETPEGIAEPVADQAAAAIENLLKSKQLKKGITKDGKHHLVFKVEVEEE